MVSHQHLLIVAAAQLRSTTVPGPRRPWYARWIMWYARSMRTWIPLTCALGLASCGSTATVDAGTEDIADGSTVDAARARPPDAGPGSDAGAIDGGPCPDAPGPPASPLRPQSGEVFYAQIGLGGVGLGEAALLVGPDGTVVLIDVGNNSHDDDVAEVVEELTGSTRVDHVVITHFHADHGDGLAELLERVTLTGQIIHRGFTDLTPAANSSTIESACGVIAGRPSANAALCEAVETPPCAPAAWTGTYPAVACAGLETEDLALGAGARLDFLAANGFIGGERYEAAVGPLLTSDGNGENARSIVGLVEHGAFRLLITGDLTGGGSDTDDVESFYAPRLTTVPASGVDVLHAGHHGRNTSTNPTWVARLLPADGRSRNAVMGISTAHVGSPHAEVLSALLDGDRLGEGRAWTTRVALTGATAPGLVDARGGLVLVATLEDGAAYAIQAIDPSGAVIESRAFRSAAACP